MRLALSLVMLSIAACAPKPAVRLEYAPQQAVSVLPGAEKVLVTLTGTDARKVKDRISATRNGLGVEISPIPAQNAPLDLVVGAVASELKSRGFRVAPGQARVAITLKKFYATFGVGVYSTTALGEVEFAVQVEGPAAYAADIEGRYHLYKVLRFSGENAKIALEAALNQALTKLFDDKAFFAALMTDQNSRRP